MATIDTPAGDFVAEDFRAAAVFQHSGVDVWGGGQRTLGEAGRARNVDARDLASWPLERC